ncbi:MAG TPA: 50S ribosomal protein L25 [Pirellulaceae bacterium]|nr:50S ribosomal protein L25 [Pirellulaceae bacterium]
MPDTLHVQSRNETGSSRMRRLRQAGRIPAILYGHGEANVNLVIASDELFGVIKRGGKLLTLRGDVADSALLRAVQWDTFGKSVLHVDLLRVSATEMVETTVTIELRGTAVGTTEGGVIQFITHEIDIECPAASIPEKIQVNVAELHLDQAVHASEVKLPEGANLVTPPDVVIVQCVAPMVEEEEAPTPAEGAVEPELIKKEKPADEEAEEE